MGRRNGQGENFPGHRLLGHRKRRSWKPRSFPLKADHVSTIEPHTFAGLFVLEEAPGALSAEYSEDLLCDLVRSHAPDVTTEEIAVALDKLSSRAIALGEFIENKRRPRRESRWK